MADTQTHVRPDQTTPLIVALGDSTTAGTPGFRSPVEAPPHGDGDETSQFSWWLMQRHPAWRVLNRGVNGERIDQMARRFDRDVLAQAPSLVVVLAGVNDVYQGRSADEVIAALDGLYRRATTAGLPLVAATILPYDTATDQQNATMHAINRWIAERADGDGRLWYCDTRQAVARPDAPDRLADSPDGLHPSASGYRKMADALAPVIADALAATGDVSGTPRQPPR